MISLSDSGSPLLPPADFAAPGASGVDNSHYRNELP